MGSGWGHYFDIRDARRDLADALSKLGWEVDNSKPEDDPCTDYFPSTTWYPAWAGKGDYRLLLSGSEARKLDENVPKEANWAIFKRSNVTLIAYGRNYRPVNTVAQRINQVVTIQTNIPVIQQNDNPRISGLIASVDLRVDMQTFTATFTKEKETKNTVRFQEDTVQGQPPKIGTLYVQKWVVGNTQKLKVTIEEA